MYLNGLPQKCRNPLFFLAFLANQGLARVNRDAQQGLTV
jgi:hypothetical protein